MCHYAVELLLCVSAPADILLCVQARAALFGAGETAITPVKPIDGFSGRWEQIIQRVRTASCRCIAQ